jgi:hypothetical protein
MAKKYCSMCNEKFKDGEVVAVALGGNYHHIARDLDKPHLDCSTKSAMKYDGMEFNKKVHYKGSFYDFNKLKKLFNSNDIILEFNERENGDIVRGNLELLAKKKFFIF